MRGRCWRGNDGRLCFSEKEMGRVWKYYVENVMNGENHLDHYVKGDAVEGSVDCVGRDKMVHVLKMMT